MVNFAHQPDTKKKDKNDSGVQRHNMTLIMQLFLLLQSRPDANVIDFFQFENQRTTEPGRSRVTAI